jgi:hypothetical protein
MGESTESRGVTRRTVAKGAAWAVPTVAMITPTRAMAASSGIVTLTGQNCKLPGNSSPYSNGGVYLATITNPTDQPIVIRISSFSRGDETQTSGVGVVNFSTSLGTCCANATPGADDTFTVPANSSGTFAFITEEWANSANTDLAVEYAVDGVQQPAATRAEGTLNPIAGGLCGAGGSCTALTLAQRACVLRAIGTCPAGNCTS